MAGEDTCRSCGAAVAEGNRFCPSCGASLDLEAATIPSQGSLERITHERLTKATEGEFEILERLGYGAMGSVYLAREIALSRRVAIKVVSPHLLEDETIVARFRLEAQTVAALRHPNIVNLYGVRQLGDLHYFIMDFIDGPSLRSLMKAHAPLDIDVARALLFQVGSALHYAHRRGRGVIHRDIKPANIMVDREGQAVVMDFGISRVGEDRSGLTQTGTTIGTPEYMSPEQCKDKELTGASDQYALGVVAYEMLTGNVPFKGSTYAVMMAHAGDPPPPVRARRPDCPPEVEAAVLRMLAKSPDTRFPDIEAAVVALGGAPMGPGDPVRAKIVALAESVSTSVGALDDSSPLSPVPQSRRAATEVVDASEELAAAVEPEPGPEPDPESGVAPQPESGPRPEPVSAPASESTPEPTSAEIGVAPSAARGSSFLLSPGAWKLAAVGGIFLLFGIGLAQFAGREAPARLDPAAGGPSAAGAGAEDQAPAAGPPEALDEVAAEGSAAGGAPGDEPTTAQPTGSSRPTGAASPAVTPTPDATVVSIRLEGGARTLPAGGRTRIRATPVNRGGDPVASVEVEWRTSDPSVARVQDGEIVATGVGDVTVTARSGGVQASVDLTVEAPELPPPTREEAQREVQRFVTLLRRGPPDGLQRLLQRAAGGGDTDEVLGRMREANFSARTVSLGEPRVASPGAYVDFEIEMSWRTPRGARNSRNVPFRALLRPTSEGWRLAGVQRRAPGG